jgi:hypothetical protein
MAKVYITEYVAMGQEWAGSRPIAAVQEPANVDQAPITLSATSQQSEPFAGNSRLVRVHTDGVCSFSFGEDPTATTSNRRMGAGQTEYFGVVPGHRIAVIENT